MVDEYAFGEMDEVGKTNFAQMSLLVRVPNRRR
jgi:hypothetical protein